MYKSNWFSCVSFAIFSEDILNYEIGDVDADDTDLTGADEDELLLSDDGKIHKKFRLSNFNLSTYSIHLKNFVHFRVIFGAIGAESEKR